MVISISPDGYGTTGNDPYIFIPLSNGDNLQRTFPADKLNAMQQRRHFQGGRSSY